VKLQLIQACKTKIITFYISMWEKCIEKTWGCIKQVNGGEFSKSRRLDSFVGGS